MRFLCSAIVACESRTIKTDDGEGFLTIGVGEQKRKPEGMGQVPCVEQRSIWEDRFRFEETVVGPWV